MKDYNIAKHVLIAGFFFDTVEFIVVFVCFLCTYTYMVFILMI